VEWIDALRCEIVALDTAPLIYFIENRDAAVERASARSGVRLRTEARFFSTEKR
jgi:hypothetical protein